MLVTSANFQTSAPDLASCPATSLREFAFIGRSNVGKSSLINMLAGSKALAKVSSAPGHTRLLNFFLINKVWTLVDLPGYGYAKTGQATREQFAGMITDYLTGRPNLSGVFVLIDSRHPPQRIDRDFVHWLADESVPFALVFIKTDKLKPGLVQKHVDQFLEAIAPWRADPPRVFRTSTVAATGRKELLGFIGGVMADTARFS
jgi:GTP-binding protein